MNFTHLYRRYDRSLVLMLGAICSLAFTLLAFGWQNYQASPTQPKPSDDEMRVIDFEYQLVNLPKAQSVENTSKTTTQSASTRIVTTTTDWPEAPGLSTPDLPLLPDEWIDTAEVFVQGTEVFPTFPGGDMALLRYLSSKLRYTAAAIEHRIQGRVYLSFMVNIDGSISQVKVLRGLGFGLDQEAIRVVENMPRWQPGYQNGRPVAVTYQLPVQFSLR